MSEMYNQKYLIYRNFYNPYLLNMVPPGSKVLDVGCNGGQFGKILQEKNHCIVYGVDISSAAVNDAKQLLKAAETMDITHDPFPFIEEKFDIIVFGDVLEHIPDPLDVLRKFTVYLNSGGSILLSLPNVANISIRLKLLIGKWDYKPSGILDETHLRFFTLKSIKDLMLKADLIIKKMEISPGFSFGISSIFPTFHHLTDKLCLLRPSLFAYQFIILAQKNDFPLHE